MFYFPYQGNKRLEIKHLAEYTRGISEKKYDTIVEPFCGSCAFSLAMYKNGFRGRIVINDADETLVRFLRDIQENGSQKYFDFHNEKVCDNLTRERYHALLGQKRDDLLHWFFYRKCFYITEHRYYEKLMNKTAERTAAHALFDEFLRHCEIRCGDYNDVFDEFEGDDRCFMFLDPPYLDSYNRDYAKFTKDGDGTYFYAEIIQKLKSDATRCSLLMVINGNSLTKYIYRKYTVAEYEKIYSTGKKRVSHLVVTNIAREFRSQPEEE
jgi:site-specific DNA-adenine methylase